jgi:hypothetical protein
MKLDGDDPSYMPVTRDLSEYRRRIVLAFLESVLAATPDRG